MYNVGDLILYGITGVCRITDITTRRFPGMRGERLYYIIRPLYQDCVISAPVKKNKSFMRPILSRAEAERLIDSMPGIRAEACHYSAMGQLTAHYDAFIKSYDCAEWTRLILSIHEKKQFLEEQKRKLGTVDEKFLKLGEELLFGELAAALGIPMDEVPGYIAARADAASRAGNRASG